MIETTILEKYYGFKILKCKGFHKNYNPDKNYRKAKEPVEKWKETQPFNDKKQQEIEEWLNENGWIGLVIPEGYIALDIEDIEYQFFRMLLNKYPFNILIHKSNYGGHFIFKLDKNSQITNKQNVMTKIGISISSYKKGEEGYIVVEPSNGRKWEIWKELPNWNEIDYFPEDFLSPIDWNKYEDVRNAIAWRLHWHYKLDTFQGYEDIDTSFMGYLIEHGLNKEEIFQIFKLIYQEEFDEKQTEYMYERALKRNLLRKSGSFVLKIKEIDDQELLKLLTRFEDLVLRRHITDDDTDRLITVEEVKTSGIVKTLGELMKQHESISWIIPSFLARKFLTLITGQPKVGKTWFIIDLAKHLTQGKDLFGGIYPCRRSKIMILEGDMNEISLKHRFAMSLNYDDNTEEIFNNIFIVSKFMIERLGKNPDLSQQEGQDLLLSLVDAYQPDIIIIDSISAFHTVSEEKSGEIKGVIQFLNYVASEKNKAVILIHHFRKKNLKDDRDDDITLDDIAGSNVFTRFSGFIYGMKRYKRDKLYDTGLFDLGSWFDVVKYLKFKKINENGKIRLSYIEVDKSINPYYFAEFFIQESFDKYNELDENYVIENLIKYLNLNENEAKAIFLKVKEVV